jgi:hypothetical protein
LHMFLQQPVAPSGELSACRGHVGTRIVEHIEYSCCMTGWQRRI